MTPPVTPAIWPSPDTCWRRNRLTGNSARGRHSAKASRPSGLSGSLKPAQTSPHFSRNTNRAFEHVVEPIKRSFIESVGLEADQRLGFTARRAVILAAVVCVLTLTIAGPVRTYFAQHTEMEQLATTEAALHRQITDLEQQKAKLADPTYIAAQARERLGFVMPGDVPFQVQLPPNTVVSSRSGTDAAAPTKNDPWYTSLWHTIADKPHLPPAVVPPPSPLEPVLSGSVPPASSKPTQPGG